MSKNEIVLNVTHREGTGKSVTRKLRSAGVIPAVMYGHGHAAANIQVPELELKDHIHHTGLLKLKVDKSRTAKTAIIKDFQRHVLTGRIIHVDFQEVRADEVINATIKVESHGTPAGATQGGLLEQVIHNVEIRGPANQLPEKIVVDVSGLELDKTVCLRDLVLPEGVAVVGHLEQIVFAVHLSKVDEATTATPAEGEAGATAAEPERITRKKEEEEPAD